MQITIWVLLFALALPSLMNADINKKTSDVSTENQTETSSNASILVNQSHVGINGTTSLQTGNQTETVNSTSGWMTECPVCTKILNLRTILVYLMGVLSSAILFSSTLCCVVVSKRGRIQSRRTEDIELEAVKSCCDQTDVNQTAAGEQTSLRGQSGVDDTRTAELTDGTEEKEMLCGEDNKTIVGQAGEVQYASIDYSALEKRKYGGLKPCSGETEYAEIQFQKQSEVEEAEALQETEEQNGLEENGVDQHGVNQDRVHQYEISQDGMDQNLDGDSDIQKQLNIDGMQI